MRTFRTFAVVAILWLLFTVSLAGWWIYFGFLQLKRLSLLDEKLALDLGRYHRMLVLEGATLIGALFVGSLTILFLAWNQIKQSKRLEDFFLTIGHEIKTPLAGIQLQSEILSEDLPTNSPLIKPIQRIREGVGRLAVQLENSLFMSVIHRQHYALHPECVDLNAEINSIKEWYPDVEIIVEIAEEDKDKNVQLTIDRRALLSIFSNLIQNALRHGCASQVKIQCATSDPGYVRLVVTDNGSGYNGSETLLHRSLRRGFFEGTEKPTSTSGTGLGFYLISRLVRLSGGNILLLAKPTFTVELILTGIIKRST